MSDKVKYVGSGLSFPAILTIIFVFLRAFNVISWSWWWVFAPLWISFGASLLIIIVAFLLYVWLK